MEEYEKISVESLNSLLSKKSKENIKLNNVEENISNTAKEYNDFVYNIDEILKNENNKNYSNNNISLDYYYQDSIVKDKDDNIININISNYLTYFKNNNIDKDEIKRIITFNNCKTINLNYNSVNENKFVKYSNSNNSGKESNNLYNELEIEINNNKNKKKDNKKDNKFC